MRFTLKAKDGKPSGQQAEDLALNFLKQQGLNSVVRNYQCRTGEIDLIMREGQQLVFVEVRYRNNARFGSAAESVNVTKQQKLISCARHYLAREIDGQPPACRFDVVAIYPSGTEKSSLQFDWIKNAFQA